MTSTNGPISESDDPAPRPVRRRFSAEYKLRIVAEYDAAPTGEKGAVLRRERLYQGVSRDTAGRDSSAILEPRAAAQVFGSSSARTR